MKKHMWKVLSLACAAALLAGCGGGKGGKPTPQGSSSDSSSTPVVTLTLDEAIAQFLGESELTVPSLDEYELDWDIFYSYSNKMYFIEGLASEDHEAEYLELIGETAWVSINDDTWYPVEEYGYLYADKAEDPTFVITFFDSVEGFYFDLSRYDGEAGDLDVSDVDTSWYVDYTYKGYEKTDAFPQAQLDAFLGTDKAITDLEADTYLYATSEAYTDEDGYYNPKAFNIVVEGDKVSDYAAALTAQGFAMEEVWTQDFDWETWEYVNVLAGYQGFDADHQLVIYVTLDDQENTAVAAYDFSDVYTDTLTTNTDWTESEKALMTEYLGEVLPFFQMGEGYVVENTPDDSYPYLSITDNYFEDRTQKVIDILLANGFKADDTYLESHGLTVYVKDNKSVYMEVWPGYSNGNDFQIYYEPSRFVAATSIEIDDGAELNIVAGSIYNLTATLAPEECDSTYAFSIKENTAAASITPEGRLTIAENAEPGTDIVVTATTSEGLTDTITVHVVADVLTGITLNAESVRLSPGKTFDIEITPSPIGASLSATPTYEWIPANGATGVSVNELGRITVAPETEVGVQGKVVVHVGELTAQLNVLIVDSAVTDHVDSQALGLTKGTTTYAGYDLAADGAYYSAYCACNKDGAIQFRMKDGASGMVGAGVDGRTIKSLTVSFNTATGGSSQKRAIKVFASNTAFEITDMYSGEMEPLTEIVFDASELTKTFTFTEKYAYVGFISLDGAVYLDSIDFVWEA